MQRLARMLEAPWRDAWWLTIPVSSKVTEVARGEIKSIRT